MTHFSAELKVGQHDGYLRAGDDDDDKENEKEAKDVIELILPDCLDTHKSASNNIGLKLNPLIPDRRFWDDPFKF